VVYFILYNKLNLRIEDRGDEPGSWKRWRVEGA